jgi:predicted permease
MRRLFRALRWFATRRQREAELQAELEFHLEQETAEACERGLTDHDARRAARCDLGNRAIIEEDMRAAWGWTWLERAGQDLRYAGRLLRRRPAFSTTAIVTLMLGMGGTTAVFSLFDAMVLRMLRVDRPEALVRFADPRADGTLTEAFTLATHDALHRGSTTLSGVIASSISFGRPGEIEVAGDRRSAFVQLVSDNYFDVLGVRAYRGRVFRRSPSTAGDAVAVISADYWRRQYGADASALGTRFRRDNREFTIAGIAPPGFRGTELDVPVDIWLSIDQVVPPNAGDRVRGRWVRVMGRLRDGVTPESAAAESAAILGRPIRVQPGGTGYSALRLRLYQPLILVAVVVVLVLLIACTNLANLMLAATASRHREIAVRTAIGASRARIVRQLMTEGLLLSMAGAALGLGVAHWISAALLALLPPEQAVASPNLRFVLDRRALVFTSLLASGTCVMFGLWPALRSAHGVAISDLKSAGGAGQRNRNWLSRGLLVSQVVMCTALLIVAGVFLRTLENLRGQDAGYREDRLLVADVEPPREYPEARRDQLIEELRLRAAALPGVETAALSHLGQLSGGAIEFDIGFPGRENTSERLAMIEQRISPGFLRAMGTPLIAGRDFTPADDDRAPLVAIVNEAFARRLFPGRHPIGARFFRVGGMHAGESMEIVGVAKDSKWVNLRADSPPMYYRPYRQMGGTPVVRLAIRMSGARPSIARDLLGIGQSIDKRMVVSNVVPFREIVNRTLIVERLVAQVSAAFGVLALLIALVGLYGVLAYSVVRRRREIGLRIALGAGPGSIQRMFVQESMAILAVGVVIGVPLALAVTRLGSSLLFGLGPHDPASILLALSLLTVAVLAAACLPARCAARIDPIAALREE